MDKSVYPLVSEAWVRQVSKTSFKELAWAHRRGFVVSDAGMAEIWSNPDVDSIISISGQPSDPEFESRLADKYFILLLVNLYERWFLLPYPRKALEYLVIDFRNSPLLGVGDGMMPASIAGIAEVGPQKDAEDRGDYETNVSICNWLSRYVCILLKDDLLKSPLI